jgi:hypothetical protein
MRGAQAAGKSTATQCEGEDECDSEANRNSGKRESVSGRRAAGNIQGFMSRGLERGRDGRGHTAQETKDGDGNHVMNTNVGPKDDVHKVSVDLKEML